MLRLLLVVCLCVLVGVEGVVMGAAEGSVQAVGCATLPATPTWTGSPFVMPRDLGQHSAFAYETNWFVGRCVSAAGRVFGVEFMLYTLLQQCAPAPIPAIGTVVVTDAQTGRFLQETRFAESFNVSETPLVFQLPDSVAPRWRYGGAGTKRDWASQYVEAESDGFAFHLKLNATGADRLGRSRAVQAMGDHGVVPTYKSKLGTAQMAQTLITASGTVTVDGETVDVQGRFWNQHMWGTMETSADVFGWSWFCVVLDDDFVFQLTHYYHANQESSRLNFITPTGENTMYTLGNWTLTGDRPWTSPRTNTTYNTRHHIVLPKEQLDIVVSTYTLDNEINPVPDSTAGHFYEGVSFVNGTHNGAPVQGWAFTERRLRSA